MTPNNIQDHINETICSVDVWLYARLDEIVNRSHWIESLADSLNCSIGVILTDWPRTTFDTGTIHLAPVPAPFQLLKDNLQRFASQKIYVFPTVLSNICDTRSYYWNKQQGKLAKYQGDNAWNINHHRQMCLQASNWQKRILALVSEIYDIGFPGVNITATNKLHNCQCHSSKHKHIDKDKSQATGFLSILNTLQSDCNENNGPMVLACKIEHFYEMPRTTYTNIRRRFDESLHDFRIIKWGLPFNSNLDHNQTKRENHPYYSELPFCNTPPWRASDALAIIMRQFTNNQPIGPISTSYFRALENTIAKATGKAGLLHFRLDQAETRKLHKLIVVALTDPRANVSLAVEGRFVRQLISLKASLRKESSKKTVRTCWSKLRQSNNSPSGLAISVGTDSDSNKIFIAYANNSNAPSLIDANELFSNLGLNNHSEVKHYSISIKQGRSITTVDTINKDHMCITAGRYSTGFLVLNDE